MTGGAPALRPAARRAADRAVELGAAPHRRDHIGLAVHELLANALAHGHHGDPTLPIDIEVACAADGSVTIRVTDRGLAGPWAGPPPPGAPAATLAARGRGWQLVRDAAVRHRILRVGRATVVELTVAAPSCYHPPPKDTLVRTLGLLGGMAWPSTVEAYRAINEGVAARLGGAHSARLVVWSVDFAEVEALQRADDWDGAGRLLADAARRLETAGAEGLLLCTNTMHRVADAIEAATSVPLLHIADATAAAVTAAGVQCVGLLGTRFTMEQAFYRDRLTAHGIEVVVPPAAERERVHRIIYEELIHGRTEPASRQRYLAVIDGLSEAGCQGVIAGCTEIELLVGPEDVDLAWFPTTALHAQRAVDWLLEDVRARSVPSPW